MTKTLQAIRGMNDILPSDTPLWQAFERCAHQLLKQYGYQEIRLPLVEQTELFKRSIGDVTDVVQKEMYTFSDNNGDSLSLRPEGTASCVRACLEHGLLRQTATRLWYQGPMFRHERPQKGRYRQFYQIGIEAFGMLGPDVDAEIIALTRDLWRKLGILSDLTLEINSLGTPEARQAHRVALVAYFEKHKSVLDEDSITRLDKNPLRILDSKNPDLAVLIKDAPQLLDYLDDASTVHFETLKALLRALGISFVVNPSLVRGLDYYTHTVFEWKTKALGAQGTICAGGRFNGLVELISAKEAVPAIGCAMGIERILLLLAALHPSTKPSRSVDIYFVLSDDPTIIEKGLVLADQIRHSCDKVRLITNCGGGSLKAQFKRADKSGANYALILGEEEYQHQKVTVKNLREALPQQTIPMAELADWVSQHCIEPNGRAR